MQTTKPQISQVPAFALDIPAPTVEEAHEQAPAIELRDVTRTFGTQQAVDHLTLTIERGEIFGLLGPNGSGKTTTINLILGLLPITSGAITVLGHSDARRIRGQLGVVPQETALYEELSAWENLAFHADLFGLSRQEKRTRIPAMLEQVQLSERMHARVGTFSGGMKRRLALARALLHDPHLLVLDEPSLGVDVQSRNALWSYMRELSREQGKTVLLTTNYLEEAQALCDRLAIIDHGHLMVLDTPERLKQRYGGRSLAIELRSAGEVALSRLQACPDVAFVSVTQDPQTTGDCVITHLSIQLRGTDSPVGRIIQELAQQAEICDFSIREATLDEVFLRLTGAALRDA